MNQRCKDISDRIKTFSDELIAFVANLSEDDWGKVCDEEQWSVGVTARHIAGHLSMMPIWIEKAAWRRMVAKSPPSSWLNLLS